PCCTWAKSASSLQSTMILPHSGLKTLVNGLILLYATGRKKGGITRVKRCSPGALDGSAQETVWLWFTSFRSSHTTGEALRAGGRCASPLGKRTASRPAKPQRRRCGSTSAICATVSRCVCTAWTKTRRSTLCQRYRGIPHPVARQRPGIDPQIRARDHGGIV